jgi:hypothetical protein
MARHVNSTAARVQPARRCTSIPEDGHGEINQAAPKNAVKYSMFYFNTLKYKVFLFRLSLF